MIRHSLQAFLSRIILQYESISIHLLSTHLEQTTGAPYPSSTSAGCSPQIACTGFLHFKHICAFEQTFSQTWQINSISAETRMLTLNLDRQQVFRYCILTYIFKLRNQLFHFFIICPSFKQQIDSHWSFRQSTFLPTS
jgi:hypothetical protein